MSRDFREACEGARIVYAKSWGAKQFYGRAEDDIQLRQRYRDWRIDEEVMASTDRGWFMHCLPAHRGWEITDEAVYTLTDRPTLVMVDDPKNGYDGTKGDYFGGSTAAPAFAELTARALRFLGVPRDAPMPPRP